MKNICGIIPTADGMCNGVQSWNGDIPPSGYAFIPAEFISVFYSTSPAGFITVTVENNTITTMTINTEAYEAWKAAHPAPEPKPKRTTVSDILNALLGVTE